MIKSDAVKSLGFKIPKGWCVMFYRNPSDFLYWNRYPFFFGRCDIVIYGRLKKSKNDFKLHKLCKLYRVEKYKLN